MAFTSMVFLPKTHQLSLFIRKTSDKSQLENILQNRYFVLNTVKVIKNKKSL